MRASPETWKSTVSTINGKPHSQSGDQSNGPTAKRLQAAPAIAIEPL
jgi:hypothetical protein